MIWEYRQVLENVKNKLKQQEGLPEESGEIDFVFLSNLERMEEGKISVLTRKLMAVIAEDPTDGDPAGALEDMAAMLLLWSAQLRAKKQKLERHSLPSCSIGSRLQVRLPDHFPLFIGEVVRENVIRVPVLDQEYTLDEVQIIPENKPQVHQSVDPAILQKELHKNLIDLQRAAEERQQQTEQRILAFQRRK
jgi:hypothetical protein